MLNVEFSGQFKKDYKLALKRGCDPKHLEAVLTFLVNEQPLPEKYRDHALVTSRNYKNVRVTSRNYKNVRECHIAPDWLLIYRIENDRLVLQLIRTGTHSDLF